MTTAPAAGAVEPQSAPATNAVSLEWTPVAALGFEPRGSGFDVVTDASEGAYQLSSQPIELPRRRVPVVRLRGEVREGRILVGVLNGKGDAWLGFRVYEAGTVEDSIAVDSRGIRKCTVVIATAGAGKPSRATFDSVEFFAERRPSRVAAAIRRLTAASIAFPAWIGQGFVALAGSTGAMVRILVRYRHVLVATTRVEFAKRYSGSLLGMIWVLLAPALLYANYLFVYAVIFKMTLPGRGRLDYALFVFCGLVPYLGFMEAATAACFAVKQNIHLVKNVLLPIELIPVRVVAVSTVGQFVSLAILLILVAFSGGLTAHLLWLPAVVFLQILFLVGLAWILSALGVALPDLGHTVNLVVLFLVFVSPIGFAPEAVPSRFEALITLNPLAYTIGMYRDSVFYGRWPTAGLALPYAAICLGTFVLGAGFFRKFKSVLVDYE